jgi:hypothetical protein
LWIVTFTAYFDASSKNNEAITMAGFVSKADRWSQNFEPQWSALLPDGIKQFHMTDFVSSRRGWEEWKGKSSRRARLIENLVQCIRINTRKGFAVTLQYKDYDDVNKLYTLEETVGDPYSFVGYGCAGMLRMWADRKKLDYRKILCVFEDGDPTQGMLLSALRTQGFNAIPQSKENIRAFDAGDLAAWRARAIINDGIVKKMGADDPRAAERIMKSLDQLESMVQANRTTGFLGLKKTCVALGGKRR